VSSRSGRGAKARLGSLAFWSALEARDPLGSRWELVRPPGAVRAAKEERDGR
jgi:hypothetical protein